MVWGQWVERRKDLRVVCTVPSPGYLYEGVGSNGEVRAWKGEVRGHGEGAAGGKS